MGGISDHVAAQVCTEHARVCVCVPLCIVCGHVAVYGCAAHLYTLLMGFARVRYPCHPCSMCAGRAAYRNGVVAGRRVGRRTSQRNRSLRRFGVRRFAALRLAYSSG